MQAPPLKFKDDSVSVLFASEVIEHMPELEPIMKDVERVTSEKIILTMPNPAYPGFYNDPTHSLEYTVGSLRRDLNKSEKFQYQVFGLGFENVPIGNFLKKLNQAILKPFPILCPTIGIIGTRKSS